MADRSVSVSLRANVASFVSGLGKAKQSTEDLSRQMTQTGAYADQFRRKLEAATKALPKIEIDADSSPAEIKFAQVRAELEKLSSKRIGIDIDAASAQAQLQELERELEQLQGQSATIDVKADIGSALAELRAVDSEISRVNGKDARVNVNADVSGALASIGMVAAALASLPAVTSIAVGVTALGGAFAAAGAGAAAFGAVAVPSLGRINDALAAQESAAKSAGAATGGAGQSAAQAAQQAMQLEQAERRLKDAQTERRQAQEDLTRAVEDGRRALEDMNFSLDRSILSEKDAQLAVREAEARLAELQADPDATMLQLERAMLSVEMAHQRAREQEVKTQRAREDTAEANRKGIEGTKEYTDAQQRLTDAERAVADATQQLKIAQLQQQAAMSGGGGAAAKVKDAFADLNKEERALAKELQASKDAYIEWQRSLQPDVFPVISQALGIWNSTLPKLSPLVKSSAAAFSTLLTEAEGALAGPFWNEFLFNLNTQIPTAIIGLGRSFGNIATGVAGVIDAFLPFTPNVVNPIENATKAFADWGKSLKDNPQFHEFLLFVKETAPEVWELVKNLGSALVNIGEAIAPLGVGAFSGLSLLAKVVAGMDPEHIQAIALALIAIKAAQAGLTVARFFTELPGRVDKLRDGMDKAKTSAGRFGDAMKGVGDRLGGVSGLLGGGAMAAGLLILGDRLNENAVAADRFADKIQAMAGSDVDQQIKALSDEIAKLKANLGPSLDLGFVNLAPLDWDNSLEKIDQLQGRLDDLRHKKDLDAIASKTAGGAMSTMGGQATTAAGQMGGLNQSLGTAAGTADSLRNSIGSLTGQIASGMQAEISYKQSLDNATAAARTNGEAISTNTQKGRDNRLALIDLAKSANDYRQALIDQGTPMAEVEAKLRTQRSAFIDVAEQMGFSKKQAKELADQLGLIPGNVKTDVKTPGGKEAEELIKELQKKLNELDGKVINTTIRVNQDGSVSLPNGFRAVAQRSGDIMRYASGGVERYAAGGKRSLAPHVATGPTILYGEGRDDEAFIPYEQRYRDRAIALLGQVANDFGLQLNNEQAARGLSDLSVTIDDSGVQIVDSLTGVMGSLETTMGQAGTLTGSIAKVGASAEQLNAAWGEGSSLIGDTMTRLGTVTADSVKVVSGSVGTLTGTVQQLVAAIAKGGAAAAAASGGSGGGSSSAPGMVEGHGPASASSFIPENSVAGHYGLDGPGFVSTSAAALTTYSAPVNSSKVSSPAPFIVPNPTPENRVQGTSGTWGREGAGGGNSGPAVVINGPTINNDVDATLFAEQVAMRVRGRGRG